MEHVLKKSPRTSFEYTNDVRRWMKWWKRPIEFFGTDEWDDWTAFLSKSGVSSSSIKRYRVSVKRFFKYLRKRKIVQHDPSTLSEAMPRVKNLPTWLLEPEVDQIISSATTARDRAILEVLYSCGLRNAECRALTTKDDQGSVMNVNGKGLRQRLVAIVPRAREALDEWLKERGDDEGYLFPGPRGGMMKEKYLQGIVAGYVQAAKLPKRVTPHTFRHSIATHLAMRGVNVERIQLFLGHESPETTMRYIHLAQSLVQSAVLAAHPHA